MSRRIIIDKYQGNTHYNVHVVDSFGQEHHLGYYPELNRENDKEIHMRANEIWSNETKREVDLLSSAIHTLHQHDKKSGILRGNRDGLD
tara:strand:+ start:466 stop:732 length:267 start_codon:yes stop_codon:yes gene_type:complete